MTAYSPLGSPDDAALSENKRGNMPLLMDNAVVQGIAKKLNKHPAEVCTRRCTMSFLSPRKLCRVLDVLHFLGTYWSSWPCNILCCKSSFGACACCRTTQAPAMSAHVASRPQRRTQHACVATAR